jgi:hypothetical protein
METHIMSSCKMNDLKFPKTRILFICAGFVGLYYVAYIILLINVICKTGSHIF